MTQAVQLKTRQLVVEKREEIKRIAREHGAYNVRLFGSVVREQDRPDSDIDLLVDFEPDHTPGLFSIVRMEMELTEVLGRKVDMRTPEDLSQYFRDEVLQNAKLQYEA